MRRIFLIAMALGSLACAPLVQNIETVQFGGTAAEIFLPENKVAARSPAIIVIHEWWGLNDQVRNEARKLAAEGYVALAVNLYRRPATADREEAHELSRGLPEDRALRDLKAAFSYLASRSDVDSVGAIGWCMGGGQVINLAIAEPRLAAGVIYYGRLPSDTDAIARIKAPLIGFFGEEDRGILPESVRGFEQMLRGLGGDVTFHIYPGAGHAFANEESESYRAQAAEDAWAKTLSFLKNTM